MKSCKVVGVVSLKSSGRYCVVVEELVLSKVNVYDDKRCRGVFYGDPGISI